MPRGDRTGPLGMGPMTGWSRGFCSGNRAVGFGGSGFGRGFGAFGRGRGMGPGRGFGLTERATNGPFITKNEKRR